ncbi:MAG: hypothetical protein DCF12_11505 [Snowella sp.]|jgi:hypothetical protein|nr:MAG: hypothetical protein DCF12_11505 [Snowella sp.]
MKNKRFLIINRILKYEWDYFLRKFRLTQSMSFFISIIVIVITGLGDTQSFFIGDNSLIPETWKILKDPIIVRVVSILVLVLSYLWAWLIEGQQKNKENDETIEIIGKYVVSNTNRYLCDFQDEIKNSLQIETRISLWIPVRLSLFNWNLQMICKTNDVPDQELEASFNLDEGVIGYTYLRNRRRYNLEVVNVSDETQLPLSYIPLRQDNQLLIKSDIKGILALSSFQRGSIVGLLAIDVNNINDLPTIEKVELHDLAVKRITAHKGDIQLLWRMKNRL